MTAKIRLIEDNEQNRYLATFLLEKHGFSVSDVPALVKFAIAHGITPPG